MSDFGDFVVHDFSGGHHIGFDGHGGGHGDGGTIFVNQLLGIGNSHGNSHGQQHHVSSSNGLHHGNTDPSHFISTDSFRGAGTFKKGRGIFQNVNWAYFLQGLTVGPAMFYLGLFAFFTFWLGVIYVIRHNEPAVNQAVGFTHTTASMDRTLIARAREAAPIAPQPITPQIERTIYPAGSAEALTAPAQQSAFGNPEYIVPSQQVNPQVSQPANNYSKRIYSARGSNTQYVPTVPQSQNMSNNGSYYLPYQSESGTKLRTVTMH